MNIYQTLNEITDYIENNLENNIEYKELAKIMGVNVYTLQRIFSLINNISLSEYIRKRRLSNAGVDLIRTDQKIIDIAFKYQYDNATSFSRAFYSFHGLKPSEVKKGNHKLKNFSKIFFDPNIQLNHEEVKYEIKSLDELVLYGKKIKTDEIKIKKDAPEFFIKMEKMYSSIYGDINYGMVKYENRFEPEEFEYWILWHQEIADFERIVIPKSKWLIFNIPCQKAKEIQKASENFYCEFLPSTKYNLRDIPELEYYHDGVTDFLVPIE